MPTCAAWRLRCRFQELSATTSLNPQQNTLTLTESAFMMIYVYIHDCGHPICNGYYHPSRVLSQVHTRGFMPGLSLIESQAMASFAQPVLPWVCRHAIPNQQACLVQSQSGARLAWNFMPVQCSSSEWHSVNSYIQIQLGEERLI